MTEFYAFVITVSVVMLVVILQDIRKLLHRINTQIGVLIMHKEIGYGADARIRINGETVR